MRARKRKRIAARKRGEIEPDHFGLTPPLADGVAIAPRRQCEHHRRASRRAGERMQACQHPFGCPMHVLDQQHGRTLARRGFGELHERTQLAAAMRPVVHRLVETVRTLRNQQQIGEPRLIVAADA
jgi:hypothetical protein